MANVGESEEILVERAQTAVSKSNWIVGECAAKWTKKYAKGRTDQDFGIMVGLSGDQIFQRRRVWETFGDVFEQYASLKWSHFYVALNWDDAPECFQWATENEASVAEMKAWRRAQRGEDLTKDAPVDEWGAEAILNIGQGSLATVRDPSAGDGNSPADSRQRGQYDAPETVASAARESDGNGDYAPFRATAGSSPAESAQEVAVLEKKPRVKPNPDQLLERMTSTVRRLTKALNDETVKEFRDLPEDSRRDFALAVLELQRRAKVLIKS